MVLEPRSVVLMVAFSVVALAFSTVRVAVDAGGVAIEMGPFGWPRQYLPIEEINGAAAIEVEPMAYGGWGYRVRSGVRAFIVRGGPAIRIDRSAGPATLVTVDDAPIGAVSIGALAQR